MNLQQTILFGLFCALTSVLQAQCGTDQLDSLQLTDFISNGGTVEEYIEARNPKTPVNSKQRKSQKFIIPVVFHVIHEYGPENISREQILDQMRIINEDFQRLNADTVKTDDYFKSRAAGMNIEFRLAQLDPDGNCTNGITRHASFLTDEPNYRHVFELVMWDPERYLNVYVVKSIRGNGRQLAGYATFPNYYRKSTDFDGVVIRADYTGSIGYVSHWIKGRTLTHEIGHWLNLHHTFATNCLWFPWKRDGCACKGDYVDDTPPVKEPNYGCTQHHLNSCSGDIPDEPDNLQNFMDYQSDTCQNMFTQGQIQRIQRCLTDPDYRQKITTEENLRATGVFTNRDCGIVAEFNIYGTNTICENGRIVYRDQSYGGEVKQYNWEFEGGTPATSTEKNPLVYYEKEGVYKAKLTVTGPGNANSRTKERQVVVIRENDSKTIPYANPVSDSFQEDYIMGHDDLGWTVSSEVGRGDHHCFMAKNDSTNPIGKTYRMIFPPMDLRTGSAEGLGLEFSYAYLRKVPNKWEQLHIYVSFDCGATWEPVQSPYLYCTLQYRGERETCDPDKNWVPRLESDWFRYELDLSKYAMHGRVRIRFDFVCYAGSSLYIDNIRVGSYVLSGPNIAEKEVKIFPNPTTGLLHVENFDVKHYEVEIVNQLGQTVYREQQSSNSPIDLSDLTPGVYVIRLKSKKRIITEYFILEE